MRPSVMRARVGRFLAAAATAAFVFGLAAAGVPAATLPSGFSESTLLPGLVNPTAIKFAPDGRVFVAEKRGVIKVFDSTADTTPTTFADLRTNVYNFWDRGLLGLAIDPGFPARPYVYALYAYDAAIGGTAPRWGTPGADSDGCPTPPGPTSDGCVVSGRLTRLQAAGNVSTGSEQVLINDWCQQYPSHSIGTLAFGADGALYVTGGDGASFTFVDYGQDGNPINPCGDPGQSLLFGMTPPSAEGGALRSQDLRTSGDPVGLDGALLRLDPATGLAAAGNPVAGQRIVAYGMRNPFRMTVRPGTSEVWIGDVGWNDWEEVERVVSPTDGLVENFGWPCYEGTGRQAGYDGANLAICENLYAAPSAHTQPYYTYNHAARVVAGETCPSGSSSIAGLAFKPSASPYPSTYDGALFFADYSRDCIWVMRLGAGGQPDPATLQTFAAGAANPVELQFGPDGRLYYPDFDGGTIRRIDYAAANSPPTAVATANPTSGTAPLTVAFDGSASSDPDPGDTLSYAWDLDGDGAYDDSVAVKPSFTYVAEGTFTATLRVTDAQGASATASVTISVGNTPPTATIASPSSSTTWGVGDTITFAGSATDVQDGQLPAAALSWSLLLQHCPSNCHTHPLQDFSGAGGSFVTPDHDYPSYLELRLTATDSGGLTDTKTVRLDPRTVKVTLQSSPGGLKLTMGATTAAAPFSRTVIEDSRNSISAPSPQSRNSGTYVFTSWSDGGAQAHDIIARTSMTVSARFRKG